MFHRPKSFLKNWNLAAELQPVSENSHIANTSTCIREKNYTWKCHNLLILFSFGLWKNNCACSAWTVLLKPVSLRSAVMASIHLFIHRGDYCLSIVIWHWFSINLASWLWQCHLASLRILRATCPHLVLDE